MDRKIIERWLPAYTEFREDRGSKYQPTHQNTVFGGSKDGKLKLSDNFYCYSSLGIMFGNGNADAVFFQVQDWSPYCSEEAALHYFEWLFNLSPFRSVFVTKNVSRVARDKVVVVDPSMQSKLILAGVIAMRMAWENCHENNWNIPSRIQTWWELVDSGVNPKEAFLLAHNFTPRSESDVKDIYPFGIHGHLPMDHRDSTFINFMNEDYEESPPLNKVTSIGGTNSLFGGGGTDTMILEGFKRVVENISSEGSFTNPFADHTSFHYINRDQLVEAADDFISIIYERMSKV